MEEVLHKTADPIKVKLIKGQKESYGWEISVQGIDNLSIMREIQLLDAELREKYQPKMEGE